MSVTVTDRCVGCGGCLLTCPTHAFRPAGGTLLVVADRCTGCLECLEICPVDAIEEIGLEPRRPPVVRTGRDKCHVSFDHDTTSGGAA